MLSFLKRLGAKILSYTKVDDVAVALVNRLRKEPVFAATIGMEALHLYQSLPGGLDPEDVVIAVAYGLYGWLARELVIPLAKVQGTPSYVEPPLEKPLVNE